MLPNHAQLGNLQLLHFQSNFPNIGDLIFSVRAKATANLSPSSGCRMPSGPYAGRGVAS